MSITFSQQIIGGNMQSCKLLDNDLVLFTKQKQKIKKIMTWSNFVGKLSKIPTIA